ncbi:MAG TPA: hypothetical protein VKB48_03470 [Candidatus Acidoferrum sp.]|nr:hypothetical protein [Candidatus Acidoferrum sp.]
MVAEITGQAPFYSHIRERHAAVKGLIPGDVLEYRTVTRLTKSLAADGDKYPIPMKVVK